MTDLNERRWLTGAEHSMSRRQHQMTGSVRVCEGLGLEMKYTLQSAKSLWNARVKGN